MPPPKVTIIVPAFNEAKTIQGVILDLKTTGASILVIDDGSSDDTGKIAGGAGALVLRHAINRGLGASLQTGFKKALELMSEFVVTFDADGQHQAKDIPRLLAPLESDQADAVIGSRDFSKNTPYLRRVYNMMANMIGYIFFGVYVRDTQSGLRAFTRGTLLKFKPLGDRMEISSEIVGELKRIKARIEEIPIESIYTSYSMSKGPGLGQSLPTGIKTLVRLILHKFKR